MNKIKFVLVMLLLVMAAGSIFAQTAAPFVPTDHPQAGADDAPTAPSPRRSRASPATPAPPRPSVWP
jgi:hypothetical protein